MSLRDNFFTNLMMRATPVFALNDPYEGHFNKEQIRDAERNQNTYYANKGKKVFENNEYESNEVMSVIQSNLYDLGILSFTENYNNLTMWSHYANEHKGMVIELDSNESFFMNSLASINGRKSRLDKNHFEDCYEFAEKISYSKTMPRFDKEALTTLDSKTEPYWEKFIHAILLTKSNDWSYEKEHRRIVRLRDADSIICKDCPYIREQCNMDDSIELKELGEGSIQIVYPREHKKNKESEYMGIKEEIFHLTNRFYEPPIYLFRVNPKAISGVYFGCKAAESKALENIKNNNSLRTLKNINKLNINDNLYQLDAVEIKI